MSRVITKYARLVWTFCRNMSHISTAITFHIAQNGAQRTAGLIVFLTRIVRSVFSLGLAVFLAYSTKEFSGHFRK
jgi:hypothetical protein